MNTIPVRLFVALCLAMGLLAAFPVRPVSAATLTVANCNDSGPGSLRQAVLDAANNDTINFSVDCPAASPITLASQIEIDKPLNISGNGRDIVISGNSVARIFFISFAYPASKFVTLETLTLKDGNPSDANGGGAVYNDGVNLTISHVTFENNNAGGGQNAGALYQWRGGGNLTIINSAFKGNSAVSNGGAIYSQANTTVTDTTFLNNTAYRGGAYMTYTNGIISTFERVTMSGNTAIGSGNTYGQGGAIYLGFGTLNLYNSTLSGNGSASYTSAGGAILTYDSTVTIKNSAIVENLVDATNGYTGGGLLINNATLSYYNNILANNAADDCRSDGGLTVANNVNNLVEVSVGCGTPALTSDPNLGPLAANGGPTQTHALLAGSPAIDAGDDATCLATDQRGIPRPQGAHCDIGSYENKVYTIFLPLIMR